MLAKDKEDAKKKATKVFKAHLGFKPGREGRGPTKAFPKIMKELMWDAKTGHSLLMRGHSVQIVWRQLFDTQPGSRLGTNGVSSGHPYATRKNFATN
jgi:hypothetical protein